MFLRPVATVLLILAGGCLPRVETDGVAAVQIATSGADGAVRLVNVRGPARFRRASGNLLHVGARIERREGAARRLGTLGLSITLPAAVGTNGFKGPVSDFTARYAEGSASSIASDRYLGAGNVRVDIEPAFRRIWVAVELQFQRTSPGAGPDVLTVRGVFFSIGPRGTLRFPTDLGIDLWPDLYDPILPLENPDFVYDPLEDPWGPDGDPFSSGGFAWDDDPGSWGDWDDGSDADWIGAWDDGADDDWADDDWADDGGDDWDDWGDDW